jgi:hypothetical protein
MIDNSTFLKDAGAVNASGYGQVAAAAAVVNIGKGKVNGRMVVDVSAVDIANTDERYILNLMGGSDAVFTSEVSLAAMDLGAAAPIEGNVDALATRYQIPFSNEKGGILYPYVRVRHVLSGTTPSINYTARLEP